jgi:hypothetical protein
MKSFIRILTAISVLALSISSPVNGAVGIINGLTHIKIAASGTTYEGIILIKNYGTSKEEVKVFQRDYTFNFEGRKFYDPPGTNKRSNGKWITVLYPNRLVIPPGEEAQVKYIVKIPNNENLSGTYWSVLMVEVVPRIPLKIKTARDFKSNLNVNQILRYGIQIVTNISETGTREIRFLNAELMEANSVLQIDIENTGERWLRPFLYVELYDDRGSHAGRFEGGRLRIYPGTSVRYKVNLDTVPDGAYKAMVIVDNKDEYVYGAELSLDLNSLPSSKNS